MNTFPNTDRDEYFVWERGRVGIASRGEWLPTVNGEAIINHPIFASSPIISHLHAPQIYKLSAACIIKYKREDRIMHARDLSASKQSSACACYYRGVSISREQKFIFAAPPQWYLLPHKTLNLISTSPKLSCQCSQQIFQRNKSRDNNLFFKWMSLASCSHICKASQERIKILINISWKKIPLLLDDKYWHMKVK